MDPDEKVFDACSFENVITAVTEIVDDKLEVFRDGIGGLKAEINNENAQQLDNIKAAVTELVNNKLEVFREEVVGLKDKMNNENARQIDNIKAAVTETDNESDNHIDNIKATMKEIDNKVKVFGEDIREIIKENTGNTNNESDLVISEKAEERMERRHTYSSPTSAYDNDITRSASDNYLTLPNRISVNLKMGRSGASETHECHYDHIDVYDGEKGEDDDHADDDANFASTVKSFFESSTLHGFHNLIDTAIWVRVLWILAMIGAFTALSMQVVGLANDYLSFQVSTDVSVSHGDKIFPSITVCNNRRFIISKVAKLPYFESLHDSKDKNWYKKYETNNWQKVLQMYYHEFRQADFSDLGAEVVGTLKFNKRGKYIDKARNHSTQHYQKIVHNLDQFLIQIEVENR